MQKNMRTNVIDIYNYFVYGSGIEYRNLDLWGSLIS